MGFRQNTTISSVSGIAEPTEVEKHFVEAEREFKRIELSRKGAER